MARYSVSGTLTPDATTADTGDPAGTHNGQPYWSWTNDEGTWFLWFSQEAFGRYRYAINHGLDESLMWSGSFLNPLPIGNYEANLSMCTGLSTVAEVLEDESSSSSSTSSGSSRSSMSSSSSSESSSQSSATVDLPRSCTITATGSFSFTATVEKPT